jgi:paraquat-inducible protein B
VEFRGIRIGTVESIRLEFDTDTRTARIPVTFQIEPWRFDVTGDLQQAIDVRPMGQLVERGLRAQLATGNLLTGDLLISLDFFPDAPAAKLGEAGGVPVMPTVPSQLAQVTTSLTGMLDRIAQLPLEEMAERANATLGSIEAIVSGDEVKATLAATRDALTQLQQLTIKVGDDVPALTADLRTATNRLDETLARLNGLLGQASTTLESANSMLGPNSKMRYDLAEAISQLGAAARSFRAFADSLQRDPSALIRGRQSR